MTFDSWSNKVCTHIVDINFKKVTLFQGNYDFWYEYTQLSLRQLKDQTKKIEARRKELQDFIARFSANASKSRQATSRKKLLDNMVLPEVLQSSRRYPFINFQQDREIGNDVLFVNNLSAKSSGRQTLNNSNIIILDDPTNHLDLEAITSLNEGIKKFPGVILFTSHDRELVNIVANRIIEVTSEGIIDKRMPYDDYLDWKAIQEENN